MPLLWAEENQLPARERHRASQGQLGARVLPGVHSRGINPLHPSVVADAVGGVPQVVTLVVDAVGRLLVGQVPLQLVLGCPVGPSIHKQQPSVGMYGWNGFLPIPLPRSSHLGSYVLPRASLPTSHGARAGFYTCRVWVWVGVCWGFTLQLQMHISPAA